MPILDTLFTMKTGFLLLMISAFALAAEGPDEMAVRSALSKFSDAAHNGDAAAMKTFLGDGLIYVHSNGTTVENKAQCVAALTKSKPHMELKPGSTVQVYGSSAVMHGQMVVHGMTNGAKTSTPLDFVMVWVKSGNGWQMVARHTAKLPVT